MNDYVIKGEDIEYALEDEDDDNPSLLLAILLAEEVCFLSGTDYNSPFAKSPGSTCAPCVICNDLFYWGSADGEDLPRNEIKKLYLMWRADPRWGVNKWCCRHRHLRPQVPIVEKMKEEGVWDEELEALPAPPPS